MGTYTQLNFIDYVPNPSLDAANLKHIQDGISAAVRADLTTTAGDLIVGTGGGNVTRMGTGTDAQILTADSSQATGIRWIQTARYQVTQFWRSGDAGWEAAIQRAHAAIGAGGSGVLEFPPGNYLVNPGGVTTWPANIVWEGFGQARIYTQATALYNTCFSFQSTGSARVHGITFDQTGDVAQTPSNSGSPTYLCTLLHFNNVPLVEVIDCHFYSYGIVACLVQDTYTAMTTRATVDRCSVQFTRTTATHYDVSNFNISAQKLTFTNNKVTSVSGSGSGTYWKARTSFELWAPDATITGNTGRDTEVGILHGSWPGLWGNTYDSTYKQCHDITGNALHGVLIGVSVWASGSYAAEMHNVQIADNTISMLVDATYMPTQGVQLTRGGGPTGAFVGMNIHDNRCTTEWASGVTVASKNGLVNGTQTGFVSAYTDAPITDMEVHSNLVTNFPFGLLVLYLKGGSATSVHTGIDVHRNIFVDGAYVSTEEDSTYSPEFYTANAHARMINIGTTTGLRIHDNEFTYRAQVPIGLLSTADYLTGVVWRRNDYSTYTTGLMIGYETESVLLSLDTDLTVLRPLLSAPAPVVAYTTTSTKPAGVYAAGDVVWYTGSTSISQRGWLCTQAASTQANSGTLTWSNANQAYASAPTSFHPGDLITTPASEVTLILKVSGNYIYTLTPMTSWSGAVTVTPTPGTWANIV